MYNLFKQDVHFRQILVKYIMQNGESTWKWQILLKLV